MAQADPTQIEPLQYARHSDFCKVFRDDMRHLYLLAYLLTGDQKRAEQCFVAGLDDAIAGNPVFKNWARSWSRRIIIKNAIRMMTPMPGRSGAALHDWRPEGAPPDDSMDALVKLEPFERFVFILTVLESYPDGECASLMNCSKHDVVEARVRALRQFGKVRPASAASLIQQPATTGASFSDS